MFLQHETYSKVANYSDCPYRWGLLASASYTRLSTATPTTTKTYRANPGYHRLSFSATPHAPLRASRTRQAIATLIYGRATVLIRRRRPRLFPSLLARREKQKPPPIPIAEVFTPPYCNPYDQTTFTSPLLRFFPSRCPRQGPRRRLSPERRGAGMIGPPHQGSSSTV